MTKDITVQKRGVPQEFGGVARLNTKVDGGSANWIPEDETATGYKYIDRNGDYVADADGYYGYDTIEVNVPIREWDMPQVQNGCVAGYEKNDNTFYMACQYNNMLTVRPFPSYFTLEPLKSPYARLSPVKEGTRIYYNCRIVLRTGNGSQYDFIEPATEKWEQYVSGLGEAHASNVIGAPPDRAVDFHLAAYASQKVLDEETGTYETVEGTTIQNGMVQVDPMRISITPWWLDEFSQWRNEGWDEEYKVTAREMDGKVLLSTVSVSSTGRLEWSVNVYEHPEKYPDFL